MRHRQRQYRYLGCGDRRCVWRREGNRRRARVRLGCVEGLYASPDQHHQLLRFVAAGTGHQVRSLIEVAWRAGHMLGALRGRNGPAATAVVAYPTHATRRFSLSRQRQQWQWQWQPVKHRRLQATLSNPALCKYATSARGGAFAPVAQRSRHMAPARLEPADPHGARSAPPKTSELQDASRPA
ncbi:hypothetical protein XAB3213_1770010 [Xanthomonas citri pv. bilvae]|nr:hypothetical protein XAB3213_1770010 [Xanthomonas citri pv. bilvae]